MAEAEKLLEAKEKGFFSVLVNGGVVVCIIYSTKLMLKDVISQTRAVLYLGHKKRWRSTEIEPFILVSYLTKVSDQVRF